MDVHLLQLRKVLLAPGQRLGYLAISPLMPDAERQPSAIRCCRANGPRLVLPECGDAVRRAGPRDAVDRSGRAGTATRQLMRALVRSGYEGCRRKARSICGAGGPKATRAAVEPARRPQCLRDAGQPHERAGLFSISLTASDEMVERALPAFRGRRAAVDVVGEKKGPGGLPAPMSDYDFLVTFSSDSFATMSSADVAARTAVSTATTLPVLSM